MKDIKVSVLIANYNNQKYLSKCIESIKKQTYQNIEVIIHDDFSSDGSIKSISRYKNIKIIKHKKRGKYGSYNQMNAYHRAFEKSKGEIIFFLDSDKKKIISNYWPYIPPQRCIVMKRQEFKKIIDKINFNLFPDIWMDFRIGLYLKYIKKNFCILDKNLTYYRQSPEMISMNFKFLSFAWWRRRNQAHNYVKYFFLKNNIKHVKNFDYMLTSFVNFFIQ